MIILIMMFLSVSIMLLMFILNLVSLISIHKAKDREKMSPFECGFDPFSKSRTSFSIQFFIISLMFLIFDIEMTLILPLPLIKELIPLYTYVSVTLFFMITLIMGVVMEWSEGAMNWK
uniref:NADH-ubiquinone oxidoreductase chain 3 n=1 Tax=Pachypsylla venusta TaxID=38123 RepID=Q69HD1_PACVE|nr:NADH dehydrogenase subunit 3 [Pachypsylla venusta]